MDYRNALKTKIHLIIANDLTIGRSDNELMPYTSDKIEDFINQNNDNIEQVITNIIKAYSDDNDLDLLADPLLDWIGEYLYEIIDTCGRF